MRLGHYTYRFILLIAVSASMALLMKINKISFYHHYFKVIEEVEVRNSQEVGTQLMTFTVVRDSIQSFLQFIFSLLGTAILVSCFFLVSRFIKQYGEREIIKVLTVPLIAPYPIRAP